MRGWRSVLLGLGLALAIGCATQQAPPRVGNAVFLHPDGSGLSHWNAARMFWAGPDGALEWDRLPAMAVYRGHLSDQLAATSNGGATAHAFGVKVQGPDSFGRDRGREIRALSGHPGSLLREAAARGHPVGVVNDGDVAGEPGTGAFLAETDNRNQPEAQSLQLIAGRPGRNGPRTCGADQILDGVRFPADAPEADCDVRDGEPDPQVVLGGGERFFLPVGTPRLGSPDCAASIGAVRNASPPSLEDPKLECFVHQGPEKGDVLPSRSDGRNLLLEARADGWTVIRTRAEFEALQRHVETAAAGEPFFVPKLLGLFAADDLFNDEEESRLASADLMPTAVPPNPGLLRNPGDPLPPEVSGLGEAEAERKIGRLVLWGAKHGDPRNPHGFHPPTPAEMLTLALRILERAADRADRPFALVAEVESTDNFGNRNNAVGSLRALKRADEMIGRARAFQERREPFAQDGDPDTLILTAADSDGGALQVLELRAGTVASPYNPVACGGPAVGGRSPGDTVADARSVCEEPDRRLIVTRTQANPRRDDSPGGRVEVPVDGIEGWSTPAFLAEPDLLSGPRAEGHPAFSDQDQTGLRSYGGQTERPLRLPFAVAWATVDDVAGGVLSRAQGLNASLLNRPEPFTAGPGELPFPERFDNTDVYRLLYLTLFGERLPSGVGRLAEDRRARNHPDGVDPD